MPTFVDTVESNVDTKIENIRTKFFNHYETNSSLYDDCDAVSVRNSDWTIKRFLLSHKGNEELALKNLCEALEWRKSYGVNLRSDQYFSEEFYRIGGLFQYNCDKNGHMLLYFRICVHHKINELVKYIREFFVHQVNKIDQMSGSRQWAIVFDCTNGGISNVDMDMSAYMIHVLQNYFPKGYKYVLIYEMPWIMVAFWKITRNWISEEVRQLIHMANKEEIFNYIDPEMVPNYIAGGMCAKSMDHIPDGVKRAEYVPHLGFTAAQIERIRGILKISFDDEADTDRNIVNSEPLLNSEQINANLSSNAVVVNEHN